MLKVRTLKARAYAKSVYNARVFNSSGSFSARNEVLLKDGRKGWLIDKKGGWCSIKIVDLVTGSEKVCLPNVILP